MLSRGRFVALTGAGLSTDSGIPDYRGPGAPVRMPMTYAEFVSGPPARQRYWARSHLGWSRMRTAEPERRPPRAGGPGGRRAGAAAHHPERRRAARGRRLARALRAARPDRRRRLPGLPHPHAAGRPCTGGSPSSTRAGPSGTPTSSYVPTATSSSPRPTASGCPDCDGCGGVLKPDVVFFGENVPKERVERCYAAVDALDPATETLLVLGSSLVGDVRLPVRAPRRQARRTRRHRQPRPHPRRRPPRPQAPPRHQRVPRRVVRPLGAPST